MTNVFLITFFFIVVFNNSFGQGRDSYWFFGDSAGLKFTDTGVVTLPYGALTSDEDGATISSKTGELLFYTDGIRVWDKNHSLMPNGEGLLGGALWDPEYGSTTTQSAVILPSESDSNQYLLFTLSPYGTDTGLHYSVIDMTLNDENGDVAVKNLPLPPGSLTEKMTAVRHANGKDWWVYLHELNSYNFISFLVKDLIVEGPFYQDIGSKLKSSLGEMKISLQGNRLATVSGDGNINLFTLDRCTGLLSEFVDLSDLPKTKSAYGCSFSANNLVFYLSSFYNTDYSNELYQYDLTASDVKASKTSIWINSYHPEYSLGAHQLGPNNKIYITMSYTTIPNDIFSSLNQNLCVINNPDLLGINCEFVPNSVNLGSHRAFVSLPNMPNYSLAALEGSPCDTLTSINEFSSPAISARIYPNPVNTSSILRYNLMDETKGKLVIYNLLGQQIVKYSLSGKSDWISLNFDDILSGVYGYVVIAGDKIVSTDNFIISH